MIETEEQRRWWFATHPEYSWSRKGIRGGSDRDGSDDKVDPEDVDAYVNEALKYETGPVADLLKSVKRNFGTESQSIEGRSHEPSSHPAEDPAKEAFIKAFTDAGWSRERAEERWKVYKLNEGVARGVANAMTVLGAIAGARAILPGAYRWVTSAGRAITARGTGTAADEIRAGVSHGSGAAASAEAQVSATISRAKHPEAAAHVEEARAAGQPSELTIDRAGAKVRGREALRDCPSKSGKDRDEYPPKMFAEGGKGASVRLISPSDNRGAGASIGNQLRNQADGTKVKIDVED